MTIPGGPASRSRAGYAGHRRDRISPSIPCRAATQLVCQQTQTPFPRERLGVTYAGRGNDNSEQCNIAKLYRNVINDMSIREINGVDVFVLQGTRIVVPSAARKRVVRELHQAHSGLTKSFLTAHCLLYTSPSPRDRQKSRMPSSA